MPPCFSRGIPAADCCLWRAHSGRGIPLRQGTCSGVSYAKKNYLCMDTNITTMKVLLINGSPTGRNTLSPCPRLPGRSKPKALGRRSSTSGRGPCGVVSPAGNVRNWGIASFPMPCIPPCGRTLPRPTALWSARRSIMPGRTVRFARCSTACFIRAAAILAYKPAAARGCLSPWRGECDVRSPEQVFYDFEYARRVVAILEQRARTGAGRGARRCRKACRRCGCWRGTWRNC